MLSCEAVAIISTETERNLVVLNNNIANPKYNVGLIIEVLKNGARPWHDKRIQTLLALNGYVYKIDERPAHHAREPFFPPERCFHFELIEELEPQVENIIEQALIEVL